MSTDANKDTWVIEFVALPDAVPAAIRVRRWLKIGLRALKLKCTSVSDRKKPKRTNGK